MKNTRSVVATLLLFASVSVSVQGFITTRHEKQLHSCIRQLHNIVQFSSSASSDDESGGQLSNNKDGPDGVIGLTKQFMAEGNGFYSPPRRDWFADDFAFRGAVLGPMNKDGYIRNLEGFKLYEAFPDIAPNPSSYSIDAVNPRRVWFLVRPTGTHKGAVPLRYLPWAPPFMFEATGAKVEGGPEMFSVTWDREGRVKLLTVGYAVSTEGTNGGFGAAFGLLYACGVDKSILKLVQDNIETVLTVNQLAGRLDPTMPLARAQEEEVSKDIPWWSHYEKTGEIPV